VPAFSVPEIAGLLARGDWLFATGDIASARLLYERAADAGEARAAVRLGETFDPVYLDYSHVRGLHGDPGTAVFWYRRARDLGASGVASRLKRLEAPPGRN
jgi:TPR repeat protein